MRITKKNDCYIIKDDKDLVGAVKEIVATDERPILFVYITKDIKDPNYIADIVDHIIRYFKRKGFDYIYFNCSVKHNQLLENYIYGLGSKIDNHLYRAIIRA